MIYNCVICRYHEIATKGNNRGMFERVLAENIRYRLRDLPELVVGRVRGRVWIEYPDRRAFTPDEAEKIRAGVATVCGLSSFSFVVRTSVDMAEVKSAALALVPELFRDAADGVTFRVRARRSNKKFPLRSKEIEIELVSDVAGALKDEKHFKLDLDHAEITLNVEIRDEFALLFADSIPGVGGLPTGSNPKVLTLLSGGIDSPVAAYLVMKRGSPTDFITFHSSPYTPPETTAKVERIAKHLMRYQKRAKFFLVNLAEFQKAVRDNCRESFRTVLYRRGMMRIAQSVALANNCKALATGEALGQVASQTLVNMDVINRAIDMLVLRPVLGDDKLDTIAVAEKIGTMALSIVQVPDSCTVFAPQSPATAANLAEVEKEERKIPDYSGILERVISQIEVEHLQ